MNLAAPIPVPPHHALGELLYAVDLPPPISVNRLFHNNSRLEDRSVHLGRGKFKVVKPKQKGRGKTKSYQDWIKTAGQMLIAQGPRPALGGRLAFLFTLGDDCRDTLPDTDNVGKAYLDLFVKHGIIADDNPTIVRHLAYTWQPGERCCVHVFRWMANGAVMEARSA